MGVNKSFVVKNGLEVNQGLIFADIDTQKVGIGSTTPDYHLDIIGDVGCEQLYSTGVGTFVSVSLTDANISEDLKVGTDGSVLTALGAGSSVGIGSNLPKYLLDVNSSVSTGQTAIYSYGDFEATGNISGGGDLSIGGTTTIDESLFVTGITTIGGGLTVGGGVTVSGGIFIGSGIATVTNQLIVGGGTSVGGGITVGGGATVGAGASVGGGVFVSGGATISSGDFTVTSGNVTMSAGDLDITGNLNVSGVSSVGSAITMYGSSGIISATKYYGDGANLQNTIDGVGVQTAGEIGDGTTVGYGVTFLHLKGPGVSTSQYNSDAGIATVFILGPGELNIPDNFITTSMLSTGGPVWNGEGDLYVSGITTATEFKVGTAATINSSGIAVSGIVTGASFDGDVTLNNLQVTYQKLSTGRPEWNTSGDLFVDRHIFAATGVTTAGSFFTHLGVGSVTAADFYGDLTGNAYSASRVATTNDSDGTGYLVFNDYSSSGTARQLKTNANLYYNATDNELTVDAIKSEIHADGLVKEKFTTNTSTSGLQYSFTGNERIYLQDGMIHRCTSLNDGKKVLNIMYNSSDNLADHMNVGESCTVILMLACSSTKSPYITDDNGGFEIDGNDQYNVYWTNGVAPTGGSNIGYDVYTFTILRFSSTTWHIFASVQNSAL